MHQRLFNEYLCADSFCWQQAIPDIAANHAVAAMQDQHGILNGVISRNWTCHYHGPYCTIIWRIKQEKKP